MPTRLLIALIFVVLAPITRADDRILITSNIDELPTRAWAVYRNSSDENLLVYFAPREDSAIVEGGTLGQIQAVRTLGRRLPIAISAHADRVYIAYPPVVTNRQRLLRVYSVRAVPSPVGGLWVLDPAGQMQVEQPIITDANLIGLQSTRNTIWALLKENGTLELRRMTPSGWERVPVSDEIDPRRVQLSAIGADPVLIDRSGLRFKAYRFDTAAGEWSSISHELEIGNDTEIHAAPNALRIIDRTDSGKARLRYWSEDGVFQVAQNLDLPQDMSNAFMGSQDALIGIRLVDTAGNDDEVESTVELVELDAKENAVLYAGAPAVTAPVSAEEFRFLIVMMVLVMSGVLVVVILPDRADAMQLPEGVVIADPGRRLLATLIDVFLVTTIVGALVGVSALDIVTLAVIVQPNNAWSVFPMTIIAGVLYATFAEFVVGATPGKLLMGVRLVAAEPGTPHKPRFWSVLTRNIIKWVLPPVAALALIDPETLHRGDRTSRSLVVMPRRDEEPETR